MHLEIREKNEDLKMDITIASSASIAEGKGIDMIRFPATGKRIGGFRSINTFNLYASDCDMMKKDPVIWENIVDRTHGNPCETGCALFNDGGCHTYKKIVASIHRKRLPTATNKAIAKKMNISSRQVAKMRRDGRIA